MKQDCTSLNVNHQKLDRNILYPKSWASFSRKQKEVGIMDEKLASYQVSKTGN